MMKHQPTTMIFALYTIALLLGLLATSPWWALAMLFRGKYRHGLAERLGRVPLNVVQSLAGRETIWLHAVSVGELLAAAQLIAELKTELAISRPELRVVISTTTSTGQQLAKEKFGEDNVVFFPLDLPWAIDRYLDALKPQLIVLLETEFWPNFLHRAHLRHIPVAVVNARISDRSFPRYRKLRVLWRQILKPVHVALAQSPLDAYRLERIGIDAGRVRNTGNLKYDTPVRNAPESVLVSTLRHCLPDGPPLWVCGSTAPGEEAVLLAAHEQIKRYQPDLILVLAPRHPERFHEVAAMLPPGSVRRSQWMGHPMPIAPGSVFLLDSIGELAAVYGLGYLAFVGGSLFAPGGGHNPLEPAMFGIPILAGPYMQNFRGITQALQDAGALLSTTPEALARDAQYFLENPSHAFERGEQGRAQVEANRGATDRTLVELLRLLPGRDIREDKRFAPPPPPPPATVGPKLVPRKAGPVLVK